MKDLEFKPLNDYLAPLNDLEMFMSNYLPDTKRLVVIHGNVKMLCQILTEINGSDAYKSLAASAETFDKEQVANLAMHVSKSLEELTMHVALTPGTIELVNVCRNATEDLYRNCHVYIHKLAYETTGVCGHNAVMQDESGLFCGICGTRLKRTYVESETNVE
jgi:hypothetical protein